MLFIVGILVNGKHWQARIINAAFLTPSSGGISNRAVYLSKESLQWTVEPLYHPWPWVPKYTGQTCYRKVMSETHPHSSSQGVCMSLPLLISFYSVPLHHAKGCINRLYNSPPLTCVRCSSFPSSLRQRSTFSRDLCTVTHSVTVDHLSGNR